MAKLLYLVQVLCQNSKVRKGIDFEYAKYSQNTADFANNILINWWAITLSYNP